MKNTTLFIAYLASTFLISNSGCSKTDSDTSSTDTIPSFVDACALNFTEQRVAKENLDPWMKTLIQNQGQIMHKYDRPWADQTPRAFSLSDVWSFKVGNDFFHYYAYIPVAQTGDNFMPKLLVYVYDCIGNQVCYDDFVLERGCADQSDTKIWLNAEDLYEYYVSNNQRVLSTKIGRWAL